MVSRKPARNPVERVRGSHLYLTATRVGMVFNLDLQRPTPTIRNLSRYVTSLLAYRRAYRGGRFPLRVRHLYPVVGEFNKPAGTVSDHYFHQDLWAARKIFERRPASHIDVGSRIDGFVAHLLTFMPVTVVDIRPLHSAVPGLTFVQGDATRMAQFADNSVASLSSLHAIEHFGLGRYGDPIDPESCFEVLRAFARVLKPGGSLYLSVPIGVERVEFNAHRVFAPRTIVECLGDLSLVSFAAVDDAGQYHATASTDDFSAATYACGLYEFTKS